MFIRGSLRGSRVGTRRPVNLLKRSAQAAAHVRSGTGRKPPRLNIRGPFHPPKLPDLTTPYLDRHSVASKDNNIDALRCIGRER